MGLALMLLTHGLLVFVEGRNGIGGGSTGF